MGYVYSCERCGIDIKDFKFYDNIRFKDEAQSIIENKHVLFFDGLLCKKCKKEFYDELVRIKSEYFQ